MVSKKHVFWQAFLAAVLIFLIWLVIGVYFEQLRADNFDAYFYDSETSLFDSIALYNLMQGDYLSCDELLEANLNFADRIYDEARVLEKYDDSNKLTSAIKSIHRKYDLLRTILWMNSIEIGGRCEGVDRVVYFYIYNTEDVAIKSRQIAMARVLEELKQKKGNSMILIPIAIDTDIVSLDHLVESYDVRVFPSILVNEENLITRVVPVEDIEKYLDN